jgi:hypothetical protein
VLRNDKKKGVDNGLISKMNQLGSSGEFGRRLKTFLTSGCPETRRDVNEVLFVESVYVHVTLAIDWSLIAD